MAQQGLGRQLLLLHQAVAMAASQRAAAGHKFGQRQRHGQHVVGPTFEQDDATRLVQQRTHSQHGRPLGLGSEPLHKRLTNVAAAVEIDHDKIDGFGNQRALGVFAATAVLQGQSMGSQRGLEALVPTRFTIEHKKPQGLLRHDLPGRKLTTSRRWPSTCNQPSSLRTPSTRVTVTRVVLRAEAMS